jgi:hypothetical protein
MARPYLILKRYNIINKGSDYKLDNVTSEHCPNCCELLFNETNKDIDYPYVCLYCDENFYNIELKDKNGLSDVDRLHLMVQGGKYGDKCTGWAIVATMERPNKTWYTETITDIDDSTASIVDDFLTEYCEQKEEEKND